MSVLVILGFSLLVPSAQAASGDPTTATATAVNAIFGSNAWESFSPFAELLVGAANNGEILFAKILIFIVILSLVWFALKQFPFIEGNKFIVSIVSVVVSLLSIRWMSSDWVSTIVLPYTALGVALASILPLIAYFFFVEKGLANSKTMRRIAWIFAAVVFVGLYITRADSVSEFAFIYLVTAAACLLFFLIDGTIQKWLVTIALEKATSNAPLVIELRRRLQQAGVDLGNGIITSVEHDKIIKDLRKKIVQLSK